MKVLHKSQTHDSPLEDVLRDVGRGRSVPLDGGGVWLFSGLCDDDLHRSAAAWGGSRTSGKAEEESRDERELQQDSVTCGERRWKLAHFTELHPKDSSFFLVNLQTVSNQLYAHWHLTVRYNTKAPFSSPFFQPLFFKAHLESHTCLSRDLCWV